MPAVEKKDLRKQRRIRFVAKGLNPMDVRVEDADTGEILTTVVAVDIRIRPGEIPQAEMVVEDFDLDLIAETDVSVKEELGAPL